MLSTGQKKKPNITLLGRDFPFLFALTLERELFYLDFSEDMKKIKNTTKIEDTNE